MRKYIVYILLLINCNILQNDLSAQPIKKDYSRQVDSLLQQMTLEEKVGQMIQYSNDKLQTGPTIKNQNHVEEKREWLVRCSTSLQ
jgi:beta-glucosidase